MTERRSAGEVVEGIDMSGQVCVITGASSGLGRESARALAGAGAHVVLAARNPAALTEAADWIAAEGPGARTPTSRKRRSASLACRMFAVLDAPYATNLS